MSNLQSPPVSRCLAAGALATALCIAPTCAGAQGGGADEVALSEISVSAVAVPTAAAAAGPASASAGYVGGVSGIGGALRPVDAASGGIISGAQLVFRRATLTP